MDNLAFAMLATAPVSDIPSEFRDRLRSQSLQLSNCLGQFFEGRNPNVVLGLEPGASGVCQVYRPAEGVEPAALPEYLVITLEWNDARLVTSLYVPRQYAKLPRF